MTHTRSSGEGEKSRLFSTDVLSFEGGGHLSMIAVDGGYDEGEEVGGDGGKQAEARSPAVAAM